jgi:FeS assembly ATPase SufC
MATLQIKNLHVSVETDQGSKEILRGVDLTIQSGETHAIMGPNGSGKSTLAYTIAGHPKYTVTEGEITLDGEDVLEMSVDERARAGLFLAMQYPVEIPGVSVSNFLRRRMWFGVISTSSSSSMNSMACSSVCFTGVVSTMFSSVPDARTLVNCLPLVGFTTRSLSRLCSPTIMPS